VDRYEGRGGLVQGGGRLAQRRAGGRAPADGRVDRQAGDVQE